MNYERRHGILENINKTSLINKQRTFHQIKLMTEYYLDKKEIIFIDELGTNKPRKPQKRLIKKKQRHVQKIALKCAANKSVILSYSINGMIFTTISSKASNMHSFNFHLRYIIEKTREVQPDLQPQDILLVMDNGKPFKLNSFITVFLLDTIVYIYLYFSLLILLVNFHKSAGCKYLLHKSGMTVLYGAISSPEFNWVNFYLQYSLEISGI